MAEYMNKDRFLASMGLKGDETKYGNRDAEHQNRSYSTYMSYEIMDSVDDSIEEDVVEVVRCKECKHYQKDMLFGNVYCDGRQVKPDDFCSYGERRETNGEEKEMPIPNGSLCRADGARTIRNR